MIDIKEQNGIESSSIAEIRAVMANFSDEPSAVLRKEVERILKTTLSKLPVERRRGYIDLIKCKFPVVSDLQPIYIEEKNEEVRVAGLTVDSTADEILALLREKHRLSGNAERDFIKRILADAGIGLVKEEDVRHAAVPSGNNTIDGAALLATELVYRLIPLIREILSDLRVPTKILGISKETMERFSELSEASADYRDTEEGKEIELLKRLIARVLNSSARVADVYSHKLFARIDPSVIESDIALEKSSMFASTEVRCWRRYKEIYSEKCTADDLAEELRQLQAAELTTSIRR